jgi:hypothetical protein
MENVPLPSKDERSAPSYLELLAYLGITRHHGGLNATHEMAALCHAGLSKKVPPDFYAYYGYGIYIGRK